jgi:hypothetical protein
MPAANAGSTGAGTAIAKGIQAFEAAPAPAQENVPVAAAPEPPPQVAALAPPAAVQPQSPAAPVAAPAAVVPPIAAAPAPAPAAAPAAVAPTLGAPVAAPAARMPTDKGIALALEHYQTVTVNPGQSISELAVRRYGQASHTILDMVKLANPSLRNVDVVSVGQTLQLPQLDEGLVVLRQGPDQYALLLLSSPAWQRVKNLEVVLKQKGLQAQVQETDFGPGRTVYRLLIGGMGSREAAVSTGKKVQRLFREDDQVAALAR